MIEGVVFGCRQFLDAARRPAHGNGEEVLEGGANLHAGHVVRNAGMIIIRLKHGAEAFGQFHMARGDDGSGVTAHRKFAGDAGTADGGDLHIHAGAAFHLRLGMVRQCHQPRRFGMHALGDQHHRNRRLQRLAQPVDGPGNARRADTEDDELSVRAKRLGEILMLKSGDAIGEFHIQPWMPSRRGNTIDDAAVKMSANQAHLMTAIPRRKAHGRSHDPRPQDGDDAHPITLPLSASKR